MFEQKWTGGPRLKGGIPRGWPISTLLTLICIGLFAGRKSLASSRYVSSLLPQGAGRFARLVRGHWGGCEIRNHWVREALFEEDATLSKNIHLNGNLAVLRCAVIALKARHAGHLSWPTIFELSALKPAIPYNLVCNNALK